ncbi:MAG: hypothetical protein K0Q95_902 [Bacteroidota bacterium]|jgi:hypothetical protein|nr:hypothetical protein [Bacteroidota bacterium]
MKTLIKTLTWLTAFSIAMGYLETSVVVYLRKLYYPEGFNFPLVPVPDDIAITEFFREAATIIMLIAAGVLSGKNPLQRFAFFLYSFAIWDIFYYVFLKVLLDWPASLFTWDILFLIPFPWVGPVIAPCMLSLSMIAFTSVVVRLESLGYTVKLSFIEWLLLIAGSITAIISFMWDYLVFVSASNDTKVWTPAGNNRMFDEVRTYVPEHFNWWLFSIGQVLILLSIIFIFKRYKTQKKQHGQQTY